MNNKKQQNDILKTVSASSGSNYDFYSIIMDIAEEDLNSLAILNNMARTQSGVLDILLLEEIGITGPAIAKLYSNCCFSNYGMYNMTLRILRTGAFTDEEILNNINSENPVPFINDSIVYNGKRLSEINYDFLDDRWSEIAQAVRENILPTLPKSQSRTK